MESSQSFTRESCNKKTLDCLHRDEKQRRTNLAGGEDVLPVPGESHGADWSSVVGLEEGGHAPVGDAVPDLDAAVSGAADEVFAGVVPPEKIFWLSSGYS